MHVTRLAADAAAVASLREAFARRLLIEDAEARDQAGLEADVSLFALAAADPARATWPVRGAGYFLADGFADGAAAGASPALAGLRARIAARYGADALPRRRAAVRDELAGLALRAAPPRADAPGGSLVAAPPTAATRLGELLEQLTALEIVDAAPGLRPDALVAAPAPLAPGERAALRHWAARTADALADLPASTRPDWGRAMLLGMARLAAVEASLASGRLLVLDAWPLDAPRPPLPAGAEREAAFFAALAEQTALVVERRRRACLGAPPCNEAGYARLEAAVNRDAEAAAARAAVRPPRAAAEPFLPARPAGRRDLVAALPPPAAAAREWRAARTAATAARARVASWRGYELVDRNCVTELFALIDGTPGGQRAALGASVPRAPWNAIPFVAAAGVGDSPRVVARETWPSYRQQIRQRRFAGAPGWATWWAETTTVTAAGFRPGPDDSTFVFFTDGTVAARPLLGAANLAVASIDGLLGLFTWPADGGRRLVAGTRGAVYSLPELAFCNIRKGTTAWLTLDELPPR